MKTMKSVAGAVLAVAALGCSTAHASLDGAGSIMIIPIVAQSFYTSEITVRNPYDNTALPISVFYTGATGTSAAGRHTCTPLNVPALGTLQFSAATQCSLPSGSQFGYVTLEETSSYPSPFQAFSRSQTPGGNGFTVPAYPAGAIEAPTFGHYVVGLKRQASAPIYQTNCFVASTDNPTSYEISLFDSAGSQIGNTITGPLVAYQMVRYLDIFAAAGVAAGERSNVTAQFYSADNAALISFCTVQESTFFGADFRMAQPVETRDGTRQRTLAGTNYPTYYVDAGMLTRHDMAIRHPDRVRCYISSASASNLEIRLLDPNGAVVAGGNNVTDTGVIYTGPRALYNGYSNLWHLDVSPREGAGAPPTFPVFYDYYCFTGNGSGARTVPEERLADEF